MIRTLATASLLSLSTAALAVDGNRIHDMQPGTGLGLEQRVVTGRDGGTDVTLLKGSFAVDDKMAFSLALPYATFRMPDPLARSTALGNLLLGGWYVLSQGEDGSATAVGFEAHWNLGSRAWTWANDAAELWPGTGVDAIYQVRTGGDLALTWRAVGGLHYSRDYEPFKGAWLRLGGAAGVDYTLHPLVSALVEGSFTWWDTSPLEVAAVLHSEPIEGFQVRAGWVWPLAVWAGAAPSRPRAGFSESTLMLDLRMTL
ncbi:MAG: hypothetical protein JXX28_13955 [Deltaproteobacteria bacterium]|nr:hypothetical protein [Deltaproteobacteria bacterium]